MNFNEPITAEKLFDEFWSSVVSGLSATAEELISRYRDADFNNVVTKMELANRLSEDFNYYSQRAAELSRRADEIGLSSRVGSQAAQAALDSVSSTMRQHADRLAVEGLDAFSDVQSSLSSGVTRDMLGRLTSHLGLAGDGLAILLDVLDGDAYGAIAGIISAAVGIALAAPLIAAFGAIPGIAILVVGGYFVSDWSEALLNLLDPLGINPDVNNRYQSALNWIFRRDPLVLDLDGDGIETLAANGTVLFDHDGDGIKNATGWIKSDDGLLVLDRNGNGLIDNGGELFGDNTIKSDGTRAKNGFDALSDLDSNQDGKVDASDTQFANLRVWRDLNADGISQSNELFTLNQLGIQSITTASTPSNTNVGNNNVAIARGHFTYANGAEGEVRAAASLNLASNNFYREFTDSLPVAQDKRDLPNMQGSGAVRDLREAAANNATLEAVLRDYAQATTREGQLALLDNLIEAWANSANFLDWEERMDTQTYAYVSTDGGVRTFRLNFHWPWEPIVADQFSTGGSSSDGSLTINLRPVPTEAEQAALMESVKVLQQVKILEVFNGQEFFTFGSTVQEALTQQQQQRQTGSVFVQIGSVRRSASFSRIGGLGGGINLQVQDIALEATQANFVNQSYEALKQSVYEALLLQTRLKPYLDSITLGISADGQFELDFAGLQQLVESDLNSGNVNRLINVLEFITVDSVRPILGDGWIPDWSAISSAIQSLPQDAAGKLLEAGYIRSVGSGVVSSSSAADIRIHHAASSAAVVYHGSRAIDVVTGSDGNDTLYGQDGDDYLYGNEGSDNLQGGNGDDWLEGGSGNDSLNGGAGIDVLIGGAGNDWLSGGAGADVYRFELGFGADTINNQDDQKGANDVIEFGAGILPNDLVLRRDGSHNLIIRLRDQPDVITVQGYFGWEGDSGSAIRQIRFADGSVWSFDEIRANVLKGTAGADVIYGHLDRSDVIYGGDGNDTLYGQDGDDTLYGNEGSDNLQGGNGDDTLLGGAGNDTLLGGLGNDVLNGGTGNDPLNGGVGADTYIFNLGDGQDTIADYDTSLGNIDIANFQGAGANSLWFTRSGNNLVVNRVGTTDQVTIQNWYSGTAHQIERIQTDSSVLANTAVNQLVTAMAQFNVSVGAGQVVPQEVWDQLQPTLTEVWQPR